jgi:hypothetical protein
MVSGLARCGLPGVRTCTAFRRRRNNCPPPQHGVLYRLMVRENVLIYRKTQTPRDTVRRQYKLWRKSQGVAERCDEPDCVFHTQSLIWNGKPLKLILDHRNGNNSDNRPKNLRFLCPNCDSQLHTRGGGNRGRIEKSEGGFAEVSKTKRRDYILPPEPDSLALVGSKIGPKKRPR